MNRYLISVLAVLPVLLADISSSAQSGKRGYSIFSGGGMQRCTSNAAPQFTRDLTDLSRIEYIVPWGTVQGGNLKNHSYLHNKGRGRNKGVTVTSPVDARLVAASYYFDHGAKKPEYLLIFQVSCEVGFKLDHIDRLSPKLARSLAHVKASKSSRTTRLRPAPKLMAGEEIGWTDGTDLAGSWDFGVYNTTISNQLPKRLSKHAERPEGQQLEFATCPYDYFSVPLRERYEELIRGRACGPKELESERK